MSVKFAVEDTGSCGHALHFIRADDLAVAHAVLMGELTFKKVGDNFHVLVRMHAETGACGNPVFIDDPQWPEMHMIAVKVIGKGKAMT